MQNNVLSQPRFEILDGLRGVAALMVVIFHISEAFSYDPVYKHINHGFLAVDFFFVLSGFVIGYAYDNRLESGRMSVGQFLKNRLIRLQPMVLFGLIFGFLLFYFQDCDYYPRIAETGVSTLLLYVVLNFFMIPQTPAYNIRGNEELFSLNIPQWSLIYEYIANLLYVLFVHKLGKVGLSILVTVFTVTQIDCALTQNWFGLLQEHEYPWSLNAGFTWNVEHFYIGMSRVCFSFFAGLLLNRIGRYIHVKAAFWWCSLIIIAVFCTENVGGYEHPLWDGLFNLLCTLIVFPLVVCIGAGGRLTDSKSVALCNFMGRISYSLYLVHYPIVYLFFSWMDTHRNAPLDMIIVATLSVIIMSIALAYAAMRLYDEPVRAWLKKVTKS